MKKNFSGFSLIEMLVVMLLILSLASLCVSRMEDLVAGVKLHIMVYQVQRLLQVARVEAMSQDEAMIVCPSLDGDHCGGQWQQGLLVLTAAKPYEKIAAYQNQDPRLLLTYRGFGAQDKILLQPEGMLKQQNGTFTLSYVSPTRRWTKKLIMNRSGRVRVN